MANSIVISQTHCLEDLWEETLTKAKVVDFLISEVTTDHRPQTAQGEFPLPAPDEAAR